MVIVPKSGYPSVPKVDVPSSPPSYIGADYSGARKNNLKGNLPYAGYVPGSSSESHTLQNPTSFSDYSFAEYIEGLYSSVGAEQELNRLFNAEQARLNRDFQSTEAQIQRDWYESISNSSYQRSVNDLFKAGLNPVLAVSNGGASASVSGVPQGSNATVSGAQGDTLSSILNALASVASSVADFLPSISKIIKIE